MDQKDLFYAGASLAVILFLILLSALALVLALTLGPVLVLIGSILAAGIFGIIAVFAILAFFVGVWYILYAFIKSRYGEEAPSLPKKDYTLERIRPA